MRLWGRTLLAVCVTLLAVPSSAQHAETSQALYATDGSAGPTAQIGRRLFIAGSFQRISAPSGTAVVVDPAGNHVPGAFPKVAGSVYHVINDTLGGWLLVGDFTSVGGQPVARFARVAPDRTVDARYRVSANGVIRFVALAHGRIYLAGDFTTVNGVPRRGLTALNAATGQLAGWGAGFTASGQVLALSVSSFGVYVSAHRTLSGLDAATGTILFERVVDVTAIAATSTRVYVGGYGYRRPVWAVDPVTGQDTDWALGFQFRPIQGTYFEGTSIAALLLDGGRLYLSGNFHTADDLHHYLAAADAGSGAPSSWRPQLGERTGPSLVRVATSIVAGATALDATTGATLPFQPQVFGLPAFAEPAAGVQTVASAPEGAVIAGSFAGIGGVNRENLASIDLDTGQIEGWTAALPPFTALDNLVTDGTSLLAHTRDSRFLKIDAVTGTVLAEHRVSTGDVILVAMRLSGGELVTVVSERFGSARLGVITIADWSYRQLPVTTEGPSQYVTGLDVDGDAIYLMGAFDGVNGQSRPFLAAVRKSTGELLPWRPSPDDDARVVRAAGGRVWVGGDFHRIGGQRRRGLAELDPTTGAALGWNPDVPVGISAGGLTRDVSHIMVGPGDVLYVTITGASGAVVSGQETTSTVAFSTLTGRRLPWRPDAAAGTTLPDCLGTWNGCFGPGISPPTNLRVGQAGARVTLQWTPPAAAPARGGVRLEVGSAEGRADLYQIDLPATQTSFMATAPAGSYFARVRSLAGGRVSMSTPDVSFAVGPPDVPAAPLDVTGVTEGTRLTLAWQPPSTGAPAAYRFEAGSSRGQSNLASITLPGSATAYTVDAPIGFYWGRLRAVNGAGASAASNEVLLDVGAARQIFCGDGPPEAPGGLMAAVAGRTVTLTWQPSGDGSRADAQRILAGSAPGLADLAALDTTPAVTSLSVAAPPGTYYVRVIALNACGGSPASNETMVVVP